MKVGRRLRIVVVLAAFSVVFAICSAPYVVHSSLQYTGFASGGRQISASQLPSPIDLYLTNGTYYLYTLEHYQPNEVYALISQQQVPDGSLVYANQTIAQWYVQAYPPPIPLGQHYSQVILAVSLTSVSPSLAGLESYMSQSAQGALVLQLSTVAALLGPLLLFVGLWVVLKRIEVWTIVAVVWLYAALFFASDLLGSGYGTVASPTLTAAVAGLAVAAYAVLRLENWVRARLGPESSPE